jgi:hypothetical protein
LAQEEQESALITGKQFPDGFGVEPSSLSPDKRYGVLVPPTSIITTKPSPRISSWK